jgi:glutamate-1-semialdehyde 2,1-aminomutase
MKDDGWWLTAEDHPRRNRDMRARLVREVVGSLVRIPRPLQGFYTDVMQRKHDDHHASHSNGVNQLLHLISSSVFLGCYALAAWDLTTAMWAGLTALLLRQIGHAILEPPCRDKEALLLGFDTPKKTMILGVYLVIPAVHLLRAEAWTMHAVMALAPLAAWQLFIWTLVVVGGRVVYLVSKHGLRTAMIWFVKLVTDPATDVVAYCPRPLGSR